MSVCVQPNTHELINVYDLICAETQDQESSLTVHGTVGLKAVCFGAAEAEDICRLFNQSMVRQRQRGQTAPGSDIYLTVSSLPFSSFFTQSVSSTTRSSQWLNGSLKTLNERKSLNWKSLTLCEPGNIITTPVEHSLVCWSDLAALQIQFITPKILSRGYRASGF